MIVPSRKSGKLGFRIVCTLFVSVNALTLCSPSSSQEVKRGENFPVVTPINPVAPLEKAASTEGDPINSASPSFATATPVKELAPVPLVNTASGVAEPPSGVEQIPTERDSGTRIEAASAASGSVHSSPATSNGIAILSPRDGYTLVPDEPPVIIVEGEVEDQRDSAVWLVVNDRRVAVRAQNGRFRHVLPLIEPTLHIWAELLHDGKLSQWSSAVTVHAASLRPSGAVLMVEWPREASGVRMEVSAMWRERPERLDANAQALPLREFMDPSNGAPPDIFYLTDLKPGVYTFLLRYRASSAVVGVRPTLHLADSGRSSQRPLKAVMLDGAGTAVLAKVLLPRGLYWDQDARFTGKSESGETVTKFLVAEGIVWVERKVDLP